MPDPNSLLAPPPRLCAAGHSLLLDFDGTLVELVDRPDAIVVDPVLSALLRQLEAKFGNRLALVSGRSVDQLRSFMGDAIEGMAIVGSHGAEVHAGARRDSPVRPPALLAAERRVRAAFAVRSGVIVEVKSLGVAVHYRLAPEAEPAVRDLVEGIAGETGLAVQEGKMMIELRSPGHDKGSGIGTLMSEPPFRGSLPIFVGDDLTDEPGFAAAAELGGFGVLAGAPRPTAARFRLDEVAAVRAWLGQAI